MLMELPAAVRRRLLIFQRQEITEYHIYRNIARWVREPENRRVLEQIAEDEKRHAEDWKRYTGVPSVPDRTAVTKYTFLSRLLGFTFAIKLMENGEEQAQKNYEQLRPYVPEIDDWIRDEDSHEHQLLDMLDEESLQYIGSVVLGLNDALVELTGALAGYTLALQNTRLIALTGLITGIAAALSMAASEYLSTRAEKTAKHPVRAAVYTGIAYILTVALLIAPYLLIGNYFLDLAIALLSAVLVIAAFNYYLSVAKGESFRARFLEMAGISLGVAGFSFLLGFLIREFLGVDV
jgi:VIT1/CCC1 family predicted Fe2+/Mn2+ transporter